MDWFRALLRVRFVRIPVADSWPGAIDPATDRTRKNNELPLAAEIIAFAGFARGLPSFLRRRITLDEARATVMMRMAARSANLLRSLELGVFSNPRSPYLRLLKAARCEPGDVRAMLARDGVEPTLRALRDAGVHIDFEEFKCQRPIVRGGEEIAASPADFDNPSFDRYYTMSTGGSTGASRRVLLDLAHMNARLPMQLVMDSVHELLGVPAALWFEIPPGNGLNSALMRAPYGNVPERWFTPLWDDAPLRFRLATRALVAVARRSGVPVPKPEYVPLDRAEIIAQWAADTLREHGRCTLRGHVSKLLRVAVAAHEKGLDLTGAVFMGGGEPPTPAKVRQIAATGAQLNTSYHFTEVGPVGMRCRTAADANDQHLLMDHLALITRTETLSAFGIDVETFCFTTLLPTAPKMLLNVAIDDCGIVETRSCGCPWESFGFTTHIRDIRSSRKLTGEGVTLIGTDMERVLDDVLPARFGGSPLDYQLLEEEDDRGFTRLSVIVSPRVSLSDEAALIDVVLTALGAGDAGAGMSAAIWRQAGSLRVRREEPRATSRGKIMPLHVERGRSHDGPPGANHGNAGPTAGRAPAESATSRING